MVSLAKIDEAISTYVKPQTYPLAVKMLSSNDEIPHDAKRPLRDYGTSLALCQALALGRREGLTIVLDRESQSCPIALAGLGFVSATVMFWVTTGPVRVFSQELVAPRWRTAMASSFMLGAGLAYSAMSLAGGFVIVAVGYRLLFLIASGLIATGAVLFWAYFRVPRGEMARQSMPASGD